MKTGKEFYVIEHESSYCEVRILKARRLAESEKSDYADWCKDKMLIGLGEDSDLEYIDWEDLPKRQCDGQFNGCSNAAWIISKEEVERYKELNTQREVEAQENEKAEEIEEAERIVELSKTVRVFDTDGERIVYLRNYNNAQNEGGYGYLPTVLIKQEVDDAKEFLALKRKGE